MRDLTGLETSEEFPAIRIQLEVTAERDGKLYHELSARLNNTPKRNRAHKVKVILWEVMVNSTVVQHQGQVVAPQSEKQNSSARQGAGGTGPVKAREADRETETVKKSNIGEGTKAPAVNQLTEMQGEDLDFKY